MFRCINGRNVLGPISSRATILDVGTGSGRWVVEVAHEFENAMVTRMDLSPAIPQYEITENVEFIVPWGSNLMMGVWISFTQGLAVSFMYRVYQNHQCWSTTTSMAELHARSIPGAQTGDGMGSMQTFWQNATSLQILPYLRFLLPINQLLTTVWSELSWLLRNTGYYLNCLINEVTETPNDKIPIEPITVANQNPYHVKGSLYLLRNKSLTFWGRHSIISRWSSYNRGRRNRKSSKRGMLPTLKRRRI